MWMFSLDVTPHCTCTSLAGVVIYSFVAVSVENNNMKLKVRTALRILRLRSLRKKKQTTSVFTITIYLDETSPAHSFILVNLISYLVKSEVLPNETFHRR